MPASKRADKKRQYVIGKPKYVIVDAYGDTISARRDTEHGAWVNAAYKKGAISPQEKEEMIEKLKISGCKAEKNSKLRGRSSSEDGPIGTEVFLHMRLSPNDEFMLDRLVDVYTYKNTEKIDYGINRSWVIRKLITEKISLLGIKA